MSCGFCRKFYTLSTQCKSFENRLRFYKVTESLKVRTFFTHSVYIPLTKLSSFYLNIELV